MSNVTHFLSVFPRGIDIPLGGDWSLYWDIQGTLLVISLIAGYILVRRKLIRVYRNILRREQQQEQRLLRSQMSPHFLFNALANLVGFVRTKQSEHAIEFADKFSQVAKLSLLNAQQSTVTLKSELTALEQYLQLQEIYLEGNLDYDFIISEDLPLDNILISPMLLQPFVENAITHGLKGIPYKGNIAVHIFRNNKMLICQIEDNGQGLQGSKAKDVGKPSLSTSITENRLKLLEGHSKSKLQITEKSGPEGTGVIVYLEIPYVEHVDE